MLNSAGRLAAKPRDVWPLVAAKRNLRRQPPPPGKPPIVPPSKKVLYTAVHREWTEPAHVEELLWRRHVYTNAMQSIRKVFAQEIVQKEREGLAIDDLRKQELEELDELISENERRNAEAAAKRQAADEKRMDAVKAEMMAEIEAELAAERLVTVEKAKEVEEMIERSANFVTAENLDQKLNEALEKPPTVFDFAIDVQGTKFVDPTPLKYQTGMPTRQKGRLYDRTLAHSGQQRVIPAQPSEDAPPAAAETPAN